MDARPSICISVVDLGQPTVPATFAVAFLEPAVPLKVRERRRGRLSFECHPSKAQFGNSALPRAPVQAGFPFGDGDRGIDQAVLPTIQDPFG